MILSRIIHHLKTQNWTAVGLEFLIVISGIVIGFQVNGWAERQAETERSHAYLERLVSDMEVNRTRYARSLAFRAGVQALGVEALSYAAGTATPPSEWQVVLAYYNASQVGGPVAVSSTYDELIATGDLRLLQNAEVTSQLSAYYGASGLDLVVNQHNPYRENVRSIIPFRIQQYIWASCYGVTPGVDQTLIACEAPDASNALPDGLADRLLSDSPLNQELTFWMSSLLVARTIEASNLALTETLLATLQAELGGAE
tara:strand:- start:2168 stop:2938 length:771 start_codon:yes stop_codon:yes gene_type:complete